MSNKIIDPVKKLFKERSTSILIVIGITAFTWILLYLGYLPYYSRTPIEEKLAYLFPIWIVLGIVGYAYLYYRVEDFESQEKNKIE